MLSAVDSGDPKRTMEARVRHLDLEEWSKIR